MPSTLKSSKFADKYHRMSLEKQEQIESQLARLFNEKFYSETLPKADYEAYKNAREKLTFKKGDSIFEDGSESKGVYFVEKGTAKLSQSGVYGKDQILRFIKEGDMVGYRSLLIGENMQAKAEAMTEMEIIFVPGEIFINLLKKDSKLAFAMLQKIAYELGESSNTITFLAQKTVRERLAEILLLLEQKLGTDPEGFIKISLTREEIANLIGTATESAIRLISEFKQDRLIETEGRNIRILSHEKLIKLGHVVL